MEEAQQYFVYIGTYASSDQPGIYIYRLDEETGLPGFVDNLAGIDNPSYLAFDSQQRHIYAVSETRHYAGQQGGSVVAIARDQASGTLKKLNQRPTLGEEPCYISVTPGDEMLLAVNYTGGSFCAYNLLQDGTIGEQIDFIQKTGQGLRTDRQEGPHPHSIVLDPSGKHVLIADLGLDKVCTYQLDLKAKKYVEQHELTVEPGTGPRHSVFSANGRYAYIINELASSITVFAYDSATAQLHARQTISTLPIAYKDSAKNTSADIHLSPDGRFLYGSNRGHDSIVVYRIEQETGMLTLVQHVSTVGKTPRNFAITPGGRLMLVANQDTDSVVVFKRDVDNGTLEPTGDQLEIPKPVCIKICAVR